MSKVEELLDNVSYENDKMYVPSSFALEMVNFIKLVNGAEGEENKTPVLHLRMLDQFVSHERKNCKHGTSR
jgi:N4 gp68-like protein